ncbi:hypothetical protein [Lysinibacter sp. HNR]|uniref:hypothetical protein n=1 Tax=Lysinibacter sp. HNR TaxID=3031408 RepID=UPI0024351368|nr:hypothetical protein [Lysinibacter sp. HNR]WGD37143.1 hypothetical protein FrondiHNR_12015 [Lysinibacter sp. HNR]
MTLEQIKDTSEGPKGSGLSRKVLGGLLVGAFGLGSAMVGGSAAYAAPATELMPGHKIVSWGSAGDGQRELPDDLKVKATKILTGGYRHGAALTVDGDVLVWGDNRHGVKKLPEDLANGKKAVGLVSGHSHLLAKAEDGRVYSWGADDYKQQTNFPNALKGDTGAKARIISTGEEYSMVVTEDNQFS